MSLSKAEKENYHKKIAKWEAARDGLSMEYLGAFKYIKSQLADWYIAIAAVCFAIGGVAMFVSPNDIKHPTLFWFGVVILIFDGVLVFFLRMWELNTEANGMPDLRALQADAWTLVKISKELAGGNDTRKSEYQKIAAGFGIKYDKTLKPFGVLDWIKYVILACIIDLVFWLFLFPILMLAPQLPNVFHIKMWQYALAMFVFLVLFVIYMTFQIKRSIVQKQKTSKADKRIEKELSS